MKNKLESLQLEDSGIRYIKSYPILKELFKNQSLKISLIELILSYQDNGKQFNMSYKNVAKILCTSINSIKNTVSKLSKEDYLITKNISNYNKETGVGGSYTIIQVNLDNIVQDIQDKMAEVTPKEIKEESNINIPIKKDNPIEVFILNRKMISMEKDKEVDIFSEDYVPINPNQLRRSLNPHRV